MTEQLPQRIEEWLLARGISAEVMREYELGWDNGHLSIPVHDESGTILFHKYRRDPDVTEGPKYRYQKGATSALYGLKSYNSYSSAANYVVICEGELDALRLISAGIPAVTSTGGARTFNDSWKEWFDNKVVYICLDNDDAGINGAFHIQYILPDAKILWLPKSVKDVTDFFHLPDAPKKFGALMTAAETYKLPHDWRDQKTKKGMQMRKKEYEEEIEALMAEARKRREAYEPDAPIRILIDAYVDKRNELVRAMKYFWRGKKAFDNTRILTAKQVPIDLFIKFNRQGFAKCVWHNDSNPSMYYYKKQNRVKCFSCGGHGDVLDVIQKIREVTLKDAITIILDGKL